MNSWSTTARRVGLWSAIAIVLLTVIYVTTGAIWIVTNANVARTKGLTPGQPFLTILETLLLLSLPAIVTLFASIHTYAPASKKTYSLAAFGFALLLAGISGVVHFVRLTAIRNTASSNIAEAFALYGPDNRLTPALAADLAAWDFFFGFGLLWAGMVFAGNKLANIIRLGLILSGALCLAGVLGPASGDMRFQYPAIVGYAFLFPAICCLLAILFARSEVN